MKKTVSITRNTRFKRLYERGANHANAFLALYTLGNGQKMNRLGITVNKKVGKAVVRNRVRRLIKESYRLQEDSLKSGADVVVVARMRAANADYSQINSSLIHLLRKSGLLQKNQRQEG